MTKIPGQWLRDILGTLFQHRKVTRAAVVRATNLNPASVSSALRYLLQRGTILKAGELQSDGGRPREVLTLNGEAAYFVAVDLEGSCIRYGLFNLVGDLRCRWEDDLEFGEPLELWRVVSGINRVTAGLQPDQASRLLAVGVSYPGVLDEAGRLTADNLGLKQFPLLSKLKEAIELPIFIEHDKHTSVVAECWLGSAQNHSVALYVIVERGIGVGILIDGKPFAGSRDMAGEFGHCKMEPEADDPCNCGGRGCLEAIASSPNIVRQYCEKTGGKDSPRRVTEVFDRARKGDTVAQTVLERAARNLGLALSHAIHLLNPEIIIFGGDVINGDDVFFPLIKNEILCRALTPLAKDLKITLSSLGLDIRLKGAMALAFRCSLSDPALLAKMCTPTLIRHADVPVLVG